MDSVFAMMDDVRIPTPSDKIFKDECAFSFHTAELDCGVYICLKNFIAISPKHLSQYTDRCNSQVYLRYAIKKQFIPKEPGASKEITKLAIGVPGGFELPQERYTVTEHWALFALKPESVCVELPSPADGQLPTDTSHLNSFDLPKKLASAITAVQVAQSALLAEERALGVAAWEEENLRPISLHAMELKQLDNGARITPSGWKCMWCDLRDNLWMNLTDGSILCGRRFWDGTGGNNHALEYYSKTGYPLVVKLGTITPEGAEVYSYAEDDMVTDPLLAEHLAHFGIDVMTMRKTDKTVAELEVSANERLEWLTLQESDRTLQPRYGPGMTGLRNLGNTCYINAVVQVLFSIPQLRWLFAYRMPYWIDQALTSFTRTNGKERQNPVDHVGLQMAKLGYSLCSGAYSWLAPSTFKELCDGPVPLLPGIRPGLFRRMVGRKKPRFANREQQDAFDFFVSLLDILDSSACPPDASVSGACATSSYGQTVDLHDMLPSSCFRVRVENRLECGLTHKVRYSSHEEVALTFPVPIEAMTNRTEFEEYEQRRQVAEAAKCPLKPDDVVRPRIPFEACMSAWTKTELIEGFRSPASQPPGASTHALQSSRLLNCPDLLCVQMGKYTVDSNWLPVKLDVEIELPRVGDKTSPTTSWRVDFRALRSPGGPQPGEQLMPEDAESTVKPGGAGGQSNPPNPAVMSQLTSMGFSTVACRKACLNTGNTGNIEEAMNWIMENMGDPDIDVDQEDVASGTPASLVANEEAVHMLMSMGLTRNQSLAALKQTGNSLEAAADWALSNPDQLEIMALEFESRKPAGSGESPSTTATTGAAAASPVTRPRLTDGSSVYELCAFVSHMGRSTNHGHYIAHIRRSCLAKGVPNESPRKPVGSPPCGGDDSEWIIFNDDHVARSETPPAQFAYLYFFRRIDAVED